MAETKDTQTETEAYALNAASVDAILAAVTVGAAERLHAALDPLHPADIADLLEQIGSAERKALMALWGQALDGEVLSELSEGVRDEILKDIDPSGLAAAVTDMQSDDVVYLVEDLKAEEQAEVLEALDAADRLAVEAALQYPEYSAGRLMQRQVVCAPAHWTVGEAIDFMRSTEDLSGGFYKVILVDPRLAPTGTVPLGRIMANRREVLLTDIQEDQLMTIRVDQPQEEVAYAFNQYHLVSAPVVDAGGRLVGVITIDDAMAVLEEEAEEDIRRLAGVGDEEELTDGVWDTAKQRFPWLAVNLATSILASMVIAQFDEVITAVVALAVLMPIVASMGGNGATQTLTVAVRALATRDLPASNAWRIVRREPLVGQMNGVAFAVLIAIVGLIWFGSPALGAVIAAAMVVNMVVAGLAGILIPMGVERAGADPALAAGAVVTTVTDVVGFFAFLGLAAVVLL